jgi:hypothetical protein
MDKKFIEELFDAAKSVDRITIGSYLVVLNDEELSTLENHIWLIMDEIRYEIGQR